jgi:phosphoribosylamine--glycine ligase
MNVLLLGSGGREHAIAWKLKQSPKLARLFIAPGNAGTDTVGENVSLNILDFEEIAFFCLNQNVNLLVVGPEEPLVRGIRDYLQAKQGLEQLLIVGPGQSGAVLEGSKDFSKGFMARHQIPTAAFKTFTAGQLEEGIAYVRQHTLPVVLKADGLAAGKGVIIAETHEHAEATLRDMLENALFGQAGSRVVIEQFLTGIELSVFVLTDGRDFVLLPEAKDYKRIGEGDTGPNTGGMGSISPVPFADETFMQKIRTKIIEPTIRGLRAEGIDYVGFIFFGLIKVGHEPYVIEYNARMGDPETQSVMRRLKSDLLELCVACANRKLEGQKVEYEKGVAATVVAVAEGYPSAYAKGMAISGLNSHPPAIIFHAGTKREGDKVLSNGGRVLAATGLGASLTEALQQAYDSLNLLCYEGIQYRKDIGKDLM